MGELLLFLAALAQSPADSAFFEQKIRPVLVKHCYSCHAAGGAQAKAGPKGGLLLDSREGLLKGGDSGPALAPGKPEESLIYQAIRHDGLQMPPTERLPEAVAADFEKWIRSGAFDPRTLKPTASPEGKPEKKIDLAEGRKHWAFQPPIASAPPPVRNANWPRSKTDAYILAKLEAKGLRPAPPADRAALLRRLHFDLVGLPPTPEELDAFLADKSPTALENTIDRLLASRQFAERWARHWLDVARYADSNGRDENLTFHHAHRYRDWTIDAIHQDKLFARFVSEQLAGDLLPAADRKQRDEQLTATGFLVVGPKVLADRDVVKRKMDVIDEQVDTVGRAFLGMTIGCARCHDHKFDPVPTTDYYALAGIFASTHTLDGIKRGNVVVSGWMERPLGENGDEMLAKTIAHQKQVKKIADEIKKVKADLQAQERSAGMREGGAFVGITVDDVEAKFEGAWKASAFTPPFVGAGYRHDDKSDKGKKSATFIPNLPKAGEYEVYVSYTASKGRSLNTPVTIKSAAGSKTVRIDQSKKPTLDGLFASVGKHRFEAGRGGSVVIGNEGTTGYVIVDAVRFVPTGGLEKDVEMAMGVPADLRKKLVGTRERLAALEKQEKAAKASAPPSPPLAMAVRDEGEICNCRVNVRGNPHQLGAEAPRGFLSVIGGGTSPGTNESGRRELAAWIVDPANPLPARVFVNRVWMHLFGEGLVRSVDNFGLQGERPTHPELLDALAAEFLADGGSLKRLVRRLTLTAAYAQSAGGDPAGLKADPENRMLGRMNRRRLEAEALRDAMLAVSRRLDPSPGGSAVTSLGEAAIDNDSKGGTNVDRSLRRSIYLPVLRNELPPLFETFDFADPDVSTGKRDVTTVPTQALYLLNSPFVREQARLAAEDLLRSPGDDAGRVKELYRRCFSRAPSERELAAALSFLGAQPERKVGAKAPDRTRTWTALVQAAFGATEFRLLD